MLRPFPPAGVRFRRCGSGEGRQLAGEVLRLLSIASLRCDEVKMTTSQSQMVAIENRRSAATLTCTPFSPDYASG